MLLYQKCTFIQKQETCRRLFTDLVPQYFFFHSLVKFFSLKLAFYDIKGKLMFHLHWQNNIFKYVYKGVSFRLGMHHLLAKC